MEEYTSHITDFVASGSFASLRENVKYYKSSNFAVIVRTLDFASDFKKDLTYTDKHGYDFLHNSNLYGGELILSNIGASIGKVFLVPNLQRPMTLGPNAIMVKTYEKYQTTFLYYLFSSLWGWNELHRISSSTAQGKFNKTDLKQLLIPIPPILEQHRIIAEIEKWFAIIDILKESQNDLETTIKQTKAKVLDLAIHGKLVPQDPSDESASELLKRINPKAEITCDNAHYEQLPGNWVVTSMETICKLTDGVKHNGEQMVNLDVKFLRGEKEGTYLSEGRYVSSNTLMILVDGENSGEVFTAPVEGYQGSTFKLLSINESMYIPYVLNFIRLKQKILRESKVGSAIPHLDKKLFKSMAIPVPPYNEQVRIVNGINQIINILDKIAEDL